MSNGESAIARMPRQFSSVRTTSNTSQFKLKPFEDYDIDVKIECCGVCGSDVHTITGGWGEGPLPICVGHEVVGKAVRVGDKVTTIKVGDRVGVGAQIKACLECKMCKNDNENYCPHMVGKPNIIPVPSLRQD